MTQPLPTAFIHPLSAGNLAARLFLRLHSPWKADGSPAQAQVHIHRGFAAPDSTSLPPCSKTGGGRQVGRRSLLSERPGTHPPPPPPFCRGNRLPWPGCVLSRWKSYIWGFPEVSVSSQKGQRWPPALEPGSNAPGDPEPRCRGPAPSPRPEPARPACGVIRCPGLCWEPI